jgi:DNA-binding transcriptional LysR family regulator
MSDLLNQHPHLEINLIHALSREIFEDVISFRIDFGIVMNPVSHPDLVIKPLLEDRVSLWRSSKAIENTLIYDPELSQAQILLKKLGARKIFPRHLHSSSLEIVARLAEAGCGVAVLPGRVAEQYPGLVLSEYGNLFIKDRLCLVYRADRHLTAAAKAIIGFISQSKKEIVAR